MLEKPDLDDEKIIACLRDDYGLRAVRVAFLPLGADLNTAVYRAVTDDEKSYFVKLRRGVFDETSVTLPKFLGDQGVAQVIVPLATKTGQLWASLEAFKVILYPFVEGRNGYEIDLSDRQWIDLGAALKRLHTLDAPPALTRRIARETYSPQWRETVRTFLARVDSDGFDDPVTVKLTAFLRARRADLRDLVGRAERLAQTLQARAPDFVVCHSDVHAGNVLMDAGGRLYIVDWDNPILAPKERDLMFAGGGQFGAGRAPQEEETLFYQGYRQTRTDAIALAYYRYERIIQDIAVECEQIFLTTDGGDDREQAFHYLMSNFLPDSTIEIARKADETL